MIANFFLFTFYVVANAQQECAFLEGCTFQAFLKLNFLFSAKYQTTLECATKPKVHFELSQQDLCFQNATISEEFTINIQNCAVLDSSWSVPFEIFKNSSQVKSVFVYFFRVSRLNLESPVEIASSPRVSFGLNIYNSEFTFVDNKNRLVHSCSDFESLRNLSFLATSDVQEDFFALNFKNVKYKRPVCELLFMNTRVVSIGFGKIFESFFKTNYPRFATQTPRELNSRVKYLDFQAYDIPFDSRILNVRIFRQIETALLSGHLRSIQNDLFLHFKKIRYISMFYSNFENLFKRQGIEWIRSINSDVHVDLRNDTSIQEQKHLVTKIYLDSGSDLLLHMTSSIFRDRDFCVFKNYPFDQLIMLDSIPDYFRQNLTCLASWLFQYHLKIPTAGILITLYYNLSYHINITACNYSRYLALCKRDHRIGTGQRRILESLEFLVFSEFLLIVATPIVCSTGIVFNTIVIIVLTKKKFEKEFKQKQYTYMVIYSVCNVLVCYLQILILINTCQQPFGLFCSSIRTWQSVQYTKLVLGEFFLYFFISMSNFTHVAFALCRLSLVGSKKGKFLEFVSTAGSKKLILVFVILSTLVTLIKPLLYSIVSPRDQQMLIVDYDKLDFPSLFYKYKTLKELNIHMYKFRFILNVMYDFINYCVFVLASIAIDLVLLRRVRAVMLEKEKKMSDQIRATRDKLRKENRSSFRTMVKYVLWNSLISVVLKIPNSITSLNDFRILLFSFNIPVLTESQFSSNPFAFPYTLGSLCVLTKVCEVFQTFGHFLFLVSLSINFFIIKRFDHNFKAAFEITFKRQKKK